MEEDQALAMHALALGEVIAVIGGRSGGKTARDVYEAIRDRIEIRIPLLQELDAAMEDVVRYDGNLSLSDCLLLGYARGEERGRILSFDSDFDGKGVERCP